MTRMQTKFLNGRNPNGLKIKKNMSNRFKNFRTKNDKKDLTPEELEKYSNTVGNAGVDHSAIPWDTKQAKRTTSDNTEVDDGATNNQEKMNTIQRDADRERKVLESAADNKEEK